MIQETLRYLRQAAGLVKTLEEPVGSHANPKDAGKAAHKGKKLHYKSLPAIVNMKKLPTDPAE